MKRLFLNRRIAVTIVLLSIAAGCRQPTSPESRTPASRLRIGALEFCWKYQTPINKGFPIAFAFQDYEYIDSGAYIGIRVPISNDGTRYIYAARSAAHPKKLAMYAVHFVPGSAAMRSYTGRIEWLDYQTATFYGIHYTANSQDTWMQPLKVPFETDSFLFAMDSVQFDERTETYRTFPAHRYVSVYRLAAWWHMFTGARGEFDHNGLLGNHHGLRAATRAMADAEAARKGTIGGTYSREFGSHYGKGFGRGGYIPGLGGYGKEAGNPRLSNSPDVQVAQRGNYWNRRPIAWTYVPSGREYIVDDAHATLPGESAR